MSNSQHERDNRANQLNPTHPAYYQSRGVTADEAQQMAETSRATQNNRSNQLNPNNAAHAAPRDESQTSSTSAQPSKAKSE